MIKKTFLLILMSIILNAQNLNSDNYEIKIEDDRVFLNFDNNAMLGIDSLITIIKKL